MQKKRAALLFWLLCIAITALSQEKTYISLEDYRLNLKSRGINVQEVIDGRLIRDSIEMINTKEKSRIPSIDFKNGLKAEYEAALARSNMDEKASPIALQINNIRLTFVRRSTSSNVIVEQNLSFLKPQQDGTYTALMEAGSYLIYKGSNVHKQLSRLLSILLDQAFDDFYEWKSETSSKDHYTGIKSPLLTEWPRKKINLKENGIYRSFADFKAGILDTSITFRLKEKYELSKGEYPIYSASVKWMGGIDEVSPLWGIRNEGNDYLWLGRKLISLHWETESDDFIVYLEDPYSLSVGDAAFIGGILGGISGGIAASYLATEINEIKDTRTARHKISNITGALIPAYKGVREKLYIIPSRNIGENSAFMISVEGEDFCKQNSLQYSQISVPDEDRHLKICVSTNEQKDCKIIPLPIGKDKFLLVRKKRNGKIKLDLPSFGKQKKLSRSLAEDGFERACAVQFDW